MSTSTKCSNVSLVHGVKKALLCANTLYTTICTSILLLIYYLDVLHLLNVEIFPWYME